MKVAICVSGICRGNVKLNMLRAKEILGGDLFFSTWKGREKDMESAGISDYYVFDEPVVNYHPLGDIPDDVMPPVYKAWNMRELIKNDYKLREKQSHHTKQILGHGFLLKNVPEEYDMIIRIRYDTYISDKVNFTKYIEESYNQRKAIGFGMRIPRHKHLHELRVIPKIWPDKDIPTPFMSQDWGGYLMDPLIFHPRDMFDLDLMWQLHNEGKLMVAEYGWYQILSQPYGDNHESIYGGAQLERSLWKTTY